MNLAEGMSRWIIYRAKLRELDLVATSTLDNQCKIVSMFARSTLGQVEIDKIRKSDIELWMGARLQTCAPITVQTDMNVLAQVLNWLVDEGDLTARPRFPTITVETQEQDLPPDEAFLWVLANVPLHHAKALEFMMLTGLSPHELERVQSRDHAVTRHSSIDGETPYLGIGQREDFKVKRPSRRRWVPLSPTAALIWFEATAGLAPQMHPFPTVEAIQKAVERSRDNPMAVSGADRVTPKSMRSWFASKVSSEQPEHVLQRLLGHTPGSPITRKHYVRSTGEQAVDAVTAVKL